MFRLECVFGAPATASSVVRSALLLPLALAALFPATVFALAAVLPPPRQGADKYLRRFSSTIFAPESGQLSNVNGAGSNAIGALPQQVLHLPNSKFVIDYNLCADLTLVTNRILQCRPSHFAFKCD